jgi:four helix bundle protein
VPVSVSRFEDLIVWQRSKELSLEVYRVCGVGRFSRDWGLRDQIQRASVSVMSNIAEGFERPTALDFARFLGMARSSAAEVRSILQLAHDLGYVSPNDAERLIGMCVEIRRMLISLRKSLGA